MSLFLFAKANDDINIIRVAVKVVKADCRTLIEGAKGNQRCEITGVPAARP
jgi:hypothetical protein